MKKRYMSVLVCMIFTLSLCLTGCSVTNVSKLGGDKVLRNAGDFSDGVAWAKLVDANDSSTSETVLIDTEGKIIFRTDNSIKTASFKGGMGYYIDDGVYYIIDTGGKAIGTSEDLGFEKVEAYDEGVMLLSKGGADGYKYGVIDKDGQLVYEMAAIRLPDSFKEENRVGYTSEIRASYIGDDVFAIYMYSYTTLVGGYRMDGLSAD